VSTAAPHVPALSIGALLHLAWPIVVSRSTQVVVGLCDALMVADLGEAALAATTTGALDTYAVVMLPFGIVFIVQSFASQLYGKGEAVAARRYGYYGVLVAIATQLVCVAALPAIRPLIAHGDYAPDVRSLLGDYLVWRLPAAGAIVGLEALGNYYAGLGNTRLPMRVSVLAMVLNVAGNWILIGGHLGAPALGVRGAALASALSTAIAFAVLLIKFVLDGRSVRSVLPRLSMREFASMLRFGVPSGLNWFVELLAFIFFVNVVVGGLGTTALAALMVVFQVNAVSFMPAFGLSSAGAILVGQAIGAGRKDLVPRAVRLTFATVATWQVSVGVVYLIAPELLFSAFVPSREEPGSLLRVGAALLALSAAWQLFDAAAATLGEALRAAGDTMFTMWARIAIAWLVFAPGSYFTVRHLGWSERGAALWMILYLAMLAIVLFARFHSGAWRRIELTRATIT